MNDTNKPSDEQTKNATTTETAEIGDQDLAQVTGGIAGRVGGQSTGTSSTSNDASVPTTNA